MWRAPKLFHGINEIRKFLLVSTAFSYYYFFIIIILLLLLHFAFCSNVFNDNSLLISDKRCTQTIDRYCGEKNLKIARPLIYGLEALSVLESAKHIISYYFLSFALRRLSLLWWKKFENCSAPLIIYGLEALSVLESAKHLIVSFYVACALVVHFWPFLSIVFSGFYSLTSLSREWL